MDNLCHTLAGAAFAEAGLKKSTRFGSVALMVAANLPDIDVLSFLSGTPPVALRRGWTHGVIAQAILPVVLTMVLVAIGRRWPPGDSGQRPLRPLPLLMLGYVGVLSHVGLDWLNTYGVRLLMPVSRDWFYGDAVFIVDVWLWLALGAGVWLARRSKSRRPARVALVVAAAYIAAMTISSRLARDRVVDAWAAAKGKPPARVMVGPVAINPFVRTVIIDGGDHYERGTFGWWPTRVRFDPRHVPKNDRHEAAAHAAEQDAVFRGILVWSRFPYYELEDAGPAGTRVTLADMRFGPRRLFTATTVVPRP